MTWTYEVKVEPTPDGEFVATCGELGLESRAATGDEAVDALMKMISEHLAKEDSATT